MNQSFDHLHIPTNIHSDLHQVRSPYSPPVGNQYPCVGGTYSPPYAGSEKCAESKSDYQIAYSAATSRLRNAKSDTKITGSGLSGFHGLNGVNGLNGAAGNYYNYASPSQNYKSGGRLNGFKTSSNCDISIEGDGKMSAEEIDSRLHQVMIVRQVTHVSTYSQAPYIVD